MQGVTGPITNVSIDVPANIQSDGAGRNSPNRPPLHQSRTGRSAMAKLPGMKDTLWSTDTMNGLSRGLVEQQSMTPANERCSISDVQGTFD